MEPVTADPLIDAVLTPPRPCPSIGAQAVPRRTLSAAPLPMPPMARLEVRALYRYPLKSAAAEACAALDIEPRGAAHDRRWMLIDGNGRFVTGRQLGRLVRVQATPLPGGLRLALDGTSIDVEYPAADGARIEVEVWGDRVAALAAAADAQVWLGRCVGEGLRLVHMDAAARRPVDPRWAQPGDEVSFADGYPLLLLSQAALDQLSAEVGEAIDARRFRPNIVVDGCAAHAEDGWRRIVIDGVEFDVVKPCTRCVFTTVDPDSGERHPRGEPLATLKRYRRGAAGVQFGVNLIPRGSGFIRCRAAVELG